MVDYDSVHKHSSVVLLPCKIGDMMFGVRNYCGVCSAQYGQVSEMYFVQGVKPEDPMELHVVLKHICRGKVGKDIFHSLGACQVECERRNSR